MMTEDLAHIPGVGIDREVIRGEDIDKDVLQVRLVLMEAVEITGMNFLCLVYMLLHSHFFLPGVKHSARDITFGRTSSSISHNTAADRIFV